MPLSNSTSWDRSPWSSSTKMTCCSQLRYCFLISSSLSGWKFSDPLLQIEQKLLPPEPSSIASELPILIYYAVTWDDDGDPILAVRVADRPLRAGRGNLPRQVFVGSSLAIRYTQQLVPDALLKRRTRINQR